MKKLAGALRKVTGVAFVFSLSCAGSVALAQSASLTLLHNNDGESLLLGSGEFGGVAYFASVVDQTRGAAQANGRDVLFVSSGDNVLAGIAFTASLSAGIYYDAVALAKLDYDAITLGNHDFDFGPETLAGFITGYTSAGGTAPFLSANLDVSAEPALQAHAEADRIARSTIVERGEHRYGIIAATTETLPTVSSPRNVTVSDVLAAVQAEVAALEGQGIDKIILSSHLQGIASELALISQLRGVDVVIAGGGDEYLFNLDAGGDRYSASVGGVTFGPYPLTATDLDGRTVPVVTTIGEYRYLGRLDVEFDENGVVTAFAGNPILVDPQAPGAAQDATLVADVIEPLIVAQNQLAANVIGTTEVALNGRRGAVASAGGVTAATVPGVRNAETNEGDLVADALLWRALNTPESGLTPESRVITMNNGGGIRNDNVIAPGNVSERTTIDILPFDNRLTVVYGVTPQALKDVLENAVSRWEFGDGRFLQIANFRFIWDPRQPATTFATAANSMTAVASAGSRIQRIEFLDDGAVIYDAQTGTWYEGVIDVVTNHFTADGGDGFSFAGNNPPVGAPELSRVNLPYTYQRALYDYISDENGLNGVISAGQYPEGGSTRIVVRFDVDGDGDMTRTTST
jgi:5'-nucleotidase